MSTVGGACSASQRVAALVHWEDAALLRFYDSFHVHRSAWDKVSADVGMPAEQCEALFRQHQTFLGLPPAPALGTAFLAMVQDHHNNLRKELEAEAAREAANAAAAGHARQGPGAEAGASAGVPGQHHEHAAEGARSAAGQEEELADGARREQAAKGAAAEVDDDEGISFAVTGPRSKRTPKPSAKALASPLKWGPGVATSPKGPRVQSPDLLSETGSARKRRQKRLFEEADEEGTMPGEQGFKRWKAQHRHDDLGAGVDALLSLAAAAQDTLGRDQEGAETGHTGDQEGQGTWGAQGQSRQAAPSPLGATSAVRGTVAAGLVAAAAASPRQLRQQPQSVSGTEQAAVGGGYDGGRAVSDGAPSGTQGLEAAWQVPRARQARGGRRGEGQYDGWAEGTSANLGMEEEEEGRPGFGGAFGAGPLPLQSKAGAAGGGVGGPGVSGAPSYSKGGPAAAGGGGGAAGARQAQQRGPGGRFISSSSATPADGGEGVPGASSRKARGGRWQRFGSGQGGRRRRRNVVPASGSSGEEEGEGGDAGMDLESTVPQARSRRTAGSRPRASPASVMGGLGAGEGAAAGHLPLMAEGLELLGTLDPNLLIGAPPPLFMGDVGVDGVDGGAAGPGPVHLSQPRGSNRRKPTPERALHGPASLRTLVSSLNRSQQQTQAQQQQQQHRGQGAGVQGLGTGAFGSTPTIGLATAAAAASALSPGLLTSPAFGMQAAVALPQLDTNTSTEAAIRHCLSSPKLRRWAAAEFVTSALDRPWFMRNELNELAVALISSTTAPGQTAALGAGPSASASGASPTAAAAAALGTLGPGVGGVGGVRRPGLLAPRVLLTRAEWCVLRSAFGRPRRLSLTFLKQQRVMLEAYRQHVRGKYEEAAHGAQLPTDLPRPLQVGQAVVARHPGSRQLHDGTILTVSGGRYRVQFARSDLMTHVVSDTDIMPLDPYENLPLGAYLLPPALNGRPKASPSLPTLLGLGVGGAASSVLAGAGRRKATCRPIARGMPADVGALVPGSVGAGVGASTPGGSQAPRSSTPQSVGLQGASIPSMGAAPVSQSLFGAGSGAGGAEGVSGATGAGWDQDWVLSLSDDALLCELTKLVDLKTALIERVKLLHDQAEVSQQQEQEAERRQGEGERQDGEEEAARGQGEVVRHEEGEAAEAQAARAKAQSALQGRGEAGEVALAGQGEDRGGREAANGAGAATDAGAESGGGAGERWGLGGSGTGSFDAAARAGSSPSGEGPTDAAGAGAQPQPPQPPQLPKGVPLHRSEAFQSDYAHAILALKEVGGKVDILVARLAARSAVMSSLAEAMGLGGLGALQGLSTNPASMAGPDGAGAAGRSLAVGPLGAAVRPPGSAVELQVLGLNTGLTSDDGAGAGPGSAGTASPTAAAAAAPYASALAAGPAPMADEAGGMLREGLHPGALNPDLLSLSGLTSEASSFLAGAYRPVSTPPAASRRQPGEEPGTPAGTGFGAGWSGAEAGGASRPEAVVASALGDARSLLSRVCPTSPGAGTPGAPPNILRLVTSCIAMLFTVQHCATDAVSTPVAQAALDSALHLLSPSSPFSFDPSQPEGEGWGRALGSGQEQGQGGGSKLGEDGAQAGVGGVGSGAESVGCSPTSLASREAYRQLAVKVQRLKAHMAAAEGQGARGGVQ